MNWQTVAIPFSAGIKPVSLGRVLEQTKLLAAQNCYFSLDDGPQKRNGHTSRAVRVGSTVVALDGIVPPTAPEYRSPFSLENPGLSDYWLHGWGLFDEDTTEAVGTFATGAQTLAGYTTSLFQRDDELVVWDGFRALSTPGSGQPFASVTGQAVIPALRGEPIAKSLNGQLRPDAVDNGVLRTVAWVYDTGSAKTALRSVYSVETGACLINEETLSGFTAPDSVRVFTLGPWTHMLVQDDETELFLRSWHNDTPSIVV